MIRTYITESEVAEFIIKMERLEGDIPADSFLGRLSDCHASVEPCRHWNRDSCSEG